MAYLLVHLLLLAKAWWLIGVCAAVGYGCGKWNVSRTMMLSGAAGIAATAYLLYSRVDMISPLLGGSYFSVPGRHFGALVGTALVPSVLIGYWLQRRKPRAP